MSKYKSKVYAKVLTDLILDKKNEVKQKKIVLDFIKVLEKNGDFKNINEIIALSEIIFLNKTGNKKITIETARKIDKNIIIKNFEIKKNDIVDEKINPSIIAGIKVTINNEKQLDFSLKNKLDKIFLNS